MRKPKRWTTRMGTPRVCVVFSSDHDARPVGSIWTCHPKDFDADGVAVMRFLVDKTGPWIAKAIAIAPAPPDVAAQAIRSYGYEPDDEWTEQAKARADEFMTMLRAIAHALPELAPRGLR